MLRGTYVLLSAIAMMVASVSGEVSEEIYEPSELVRRYQQGEFKQSDTDYYVGILTKRGAPLIAIGVIFMLVFMFWSCCSCCCKCCRPNKSMKTSRKQHITFVLILIGIACIGMLIYGFVADDRQQDALLGIPGLVDLFIDFRDTAVSIGREVTASARRIVAIVISMLGDNSALDNCFGTGVGQTELAQISTEANRAINEADQIITELEATDFDSLRDDFADQMESADSSRHLGVLILLITLLVLTIIQLFLAITNTFSHRCPPKCCRFCVQPCLTFFYIILVLLLFLIAAVLLTVTTVAADVCIDPDTVILDVIGDASNDVLTYYVSCDQDKTLVNPFVTEFAALTSVLNEVEQSLIVLRNAYNFVGGAGCEELGVELTSLEGEFQVFYTAIGRDTNSDAEFDTGLLAQLNCTNGNGKYQAILNVLCGDFFNSTAAFFEVFVAFACLMTIGEILRRCLPPKVMDGEDEDFEDGDLEMGKYNNGDGYDKAGDTAPLDAWQ